MKQDYNFRQIELYLNGKNLLLSKFMKLPNILAAISLREDKNMKVYHETGKDLIAMIVIAGMPDRRC